MIQNKVAPLRYPVVADSFYPSNPAALKAEISSFMRNKEKVNAVGCMSPHAGYIYSGRVAGSVYSRISPRDVYIIIGPNHTGLGKRFGLDLSQEWVTPLGKITVNSELANAILDISKLIDEDEECHESEHSIEVQLPFLQMLKDEFTFVPIIVGGGDIEEYALIGRAIAEAVRATKIDAMIIASTDMTHYESQESAKEKDMLAIKKILNFDTAGFLKEIRANDISMCGFAPTAITLSASKLLGAKKSELVKYETSGETSGDYSSVVGYAGAVFY